jgi:hypothetical protein
VEADGEHLAQMPDSAHAINNEVKRLPWADDVEIVAFGRMPSGIPTVGVILTHGSSPLLPPLLPCGVGHLDEHLQIEKILKLGSSRVDPFDENDLTRFHADGVGQTMASHPVEAAKPGSPPPDEGQDRLQAEALPVEVVVNALRGRQFESLALGHLAVEVVHVNNGCVDSVSQCCSEGRLASTTVTVQRYEDRPANRTSQQTTNRIRHTFGRLYDNSILTRSSQCSP